MLSLIVDTPTGFTNNFRFAYPWPESKTLTERKWFLPSFILNLWVPPKWVFANPTVLIPAMKSALDGNNLTEFPTPTTFGKYTAPLWRVAFGLVVPVPIWGVFAPPKELIPIESLPLLS